GGRNKVVNIENIKYHQKINDKKSNNMILVYLMIFFIILTPNIKIGGFPSIRMDQILVFIIVLIVFIKVLIGHKIKIKRSLFIYFYGLFSFFIIFSIVNGSINGVNVIYNDLFELYKVFHYLSVYIVVNNIVDG